jgi:hypothetical protein
MEETVKRQLANLQIGNTALLKTSWPIDTSQNNHNCPRRFCESILHRNRMKYTWLLVECKEMSMRSVPKVMRMIFKKKNY